MLRNFLRVVAQSLQSNSPGAAQLDKAPLHIGAVAFIHRFGSSLNELADAVARQFDPASGVHSLAMSNEEGSK
jgi:hypothetical protein